MRPIAVVPAWGVRSLAMPNRGGAMRSLTCLFGLVVVTLVVSPLSGAQEAPPYGSGAESVDCVDPGFLSNALVDCAGGDAPLEPAVAEAEVEASSAPSAAASGAPFLFPPYCRRKVDAVFWGGRQWLELGQAIADDYSQCAEYFITVLPADGDRTQLRPRARFDEIRALNPRIHPVAEIRWTFPPMGGWREWVVGGHPDWRPGNTFYQAGVTARRRMAQRGLDVTAGETWAFNELTPAVLENAPGARAEVLEFMRGLYDGAPGMPKARGIVFNVGIPSDSTVDEVSAYKAKMRDWLTDESFWSELDVYADVFANEVYASALNWGVSGAPLARRAESLNDYFHHMTALAEAGPPSAEAARRFLRRTYLPLGNAIWPSPDVGDTDLLSAKDMSRFVSTQVYAVRHYANSHPHTAPQGRIGFGWAPIAGVEPYSVPGRDMLRTRLASAIHESSERGTNSQMGACGPPGEHVWCTGDVPGASLNEAWKIFGSWE